MTRFMIDLTQGLNVIGNKSDWHHANLANAFRRNLSKSVMQGRLQPAAGTHFALVAETMVILPIASVHQELNRFLDLLLVGVALFDNRDWDAMSAEHNLRTMRLGKTRKGLVDFFGDRIEIGVVRVEVLDVMHWNVVAEQR